jgi:hypothetical protein
LSSTRSSHCSPLCFRLLFLSIGKWRSKQLFIHGRKTCSLAHTRIGAAPLELGVWEIGELEALGVVGDVVRHCERMWADRTLARMAVPDVLEVEGIDRDGAVSPSGGLTRRARQSAKIALSPSFPLSRRSTGPSRTFRTRWIEDGRARTTSRESRSRPSSTSRDA